MNTVAARTSRHRPAGSSCRWAGVGLELDAEHGNGEAEIAIDWKKLFAGPKGLLP